MPLQTDTKTTEYLVYLTTGIKLSQIPERLKNQAITDAYDLFMAYVQDYFSAKGFKREIVRLKYAQQTQQPVLSTMPGLGNKLTEALNAYTRFCGFVTE